MERRNLEHGELTRIIIGTVVARDDAGISARELADKLNSWNIAITRHEAAVMLVHLENDGRIERVACGLYRGV